MTRPDGKHLSFPFRIGPEGRPVQVTTLEEHVRDELIQLLLTNPGERAYLPEFGGGVRKLVFEPADQAAQAMTKSMIAEAISTWLGDRIELEELNVMIEDSTIEVEIAYRIAGTEDSRVIKFQRNGEPA